MLWPLCQHNLPMGVSLTWEKSFACSLRKKKGWEVCLYSLGHFFFFLISTVFGKSTRFFDCQFLLKVQVNLVKMLKYLCSQNSYINGLKKPFQPVRLPWPSWSFKVDVLLKSLPLSACFVLSLIYSQNKCFSVKDFLLLICFLFPTVGAICELLN